MSDLKQLSEHFKNNCSFLEQKYIVDFINDQRKNSNNNKIKIALDLFYSLNEIDKNNFINNDIENFKIDSKKEYDNNFLIAKEFENLFSLLSNDDKDLLHEVIIFHKKHVINEPKIQYLIELFDDKLYSQNQVYIIDNCLLKYFNEKHNIKSHTNDFIQKEEKSIYVSEKDKKEIDNFYSKWHLMKQNQPTEYLYIFGLIVDKQIKHAPENDSLKLLIEEYEYLDPNVKLQLKNKVNTEISYTELHNLKNEINNKNVEISLYKTIKSFDGNGFFNKLKIKNIPHRIFNHLSNVDFKELPSNQEKLSTIELIAYSKNNILINYLLKSGNHDFCAQKSIQTFYNISKNNNNIEMCQHIKKEFPEILNQIPTLNQLNDKLKQNNDDLMKQNSLKIKR